jgi:hypothetical protein
MLDFFISLQIDDDFGVPQYNAWGGVTTPYIPDGISSMTADFARVDPSIFNKKDFFKPIEAIINNGVLINDLTLQDIEKLLSEFGKFEFDSDVFTFDPDNFYDLDTVFVDISKRDTRISVRYQNCPVNSLYLLQEGNGLKIIISPFTKNYYSIEEVQWNEFMEYLNKKIGTSELRNIKLNQILNEDTDKSVNLIRQLRFKLNKDSNSFLSSVLDFYEKRGYLTDKQHKSVAKMLW